MSERNFSRRRRGGMRFRPAGGMGSSNQKPDRSAQQARAEATGDKKTESVFERGRHDDEIDRAENVAAGLPPESKPPAAPEEQQQEERGDKRRAFRKPHMDTPEEVQEEKFEPVTIQPPSQGFVDNLKHVADKV
ncbi:MAG TPA: hypothetical protein VGN61_03875, partial [Verrucomicrobiae bacterium]